MILKTSLMTAALIAAAPALAQTANAPASPASPVGSSVPVGAADPASAPTTAAPAPVAPVSATPSASTAATATTGNAASQVSAVVDAGFPKYDLNKDGTLSAAEFKQWISDLKTQELATDGKPADAAAVKTYASTALKAADKDGDKSVSRAELTSFLGG